MTPRYARSTSNRLNIKNVDWFCFREVVDRGVPSLSSDLDSCSDPGALYSEFFALIREPWNAVGPIVPPPCLAGGDPSRFGETRSAMRRLPGGMMLSRGTSLVRPGMRGLLAGGLTGRLRGFSGGKNISLLFPFVSPSTPRWD